MKPAAPISRGALIWPPCSALLLALVASSLTAPASPPPTAGETSGEVALGEELERIVHYQSNHELEDPVSQLQRKVDTRQIRLKFDPQTGYLHSLLSALGVPVSSQTLVFSKTSSQREFTSPASPRAIYFGDAISIAWTPKAKAIDLASIDPNRGPIFFTLEQKSKSAPKFVRHDDCLQCHLTPKTVNAPGLFVRSVNTAADGTPLSSVQEFISGHNPPISSRWGGWYVTGSTPPHLGNRSAMPEKPNNPEASALTGLKERFNTSPYLTDQSDVVALLILEHQARMQNLITHANYESRSAFSQAAPGEDSTVKPPERVRLAGEMLLEYLLFRNEAPLPRPVRGASGFAEEFQRIGPHDSRGRSLRDLELHSRLFRYPCSYLIYSKSFDALPTPMRKYLWHRLKDILTGADRSAAYAGMTSEDRRAILEILRETKPEFARAE